MKLERIAYWLAIFGLCFILIFTVIGILFIPIILMDAIDNDRF